MNILEAIESSDPVSTTAWLDTLECSEREIWDIHLSLFPVVQRILNPPYINPHLPKMYRVIRELLAYLSKDESEALLRLEANEYTTRPKLDRLTRVKALKTTVSFKDLQSALAAQDLEKAATLMNTLYTHDGAAEFAKRLLLLGNGYLDNSLGHSVSCTSLILLEMIERTDLDPWPALVLLADYFCKGQFLAFPETKKPAPVHLEESIDRYIRKAVSGTGILNLHHTITIYTLYRVRHLFDKAEFGHMLDSWANWIGEKEVNQVKLPDAVGKPVGNHEDFDDLYSGLDPGPLTASIVPMLSSPSSREQLGSYLIKSLCGQYKGSFDPHYITGLGSVIWIMGKYWDQEDLVLNAMYQYLGYVFDGLRP